MDLFGLHYNLELGMTMTLTLHFTSKGTEAWDPGRLTPEFIVLSTTLLLQVLCKGHIDITVYCPRVLLLEGMGHIECYFIGFGHENSSLLQEAPVKVRCSAMTSLPLLNRKNQKELPEVHGLPRRLLPFPVTVSDPASQQMSCCLVTT